MKYCKISKEELEIIKTTLELIDDKVRPSFQGAVPALFTPETRLEKYLKQALEIVNRIWKEEKC